MVKDVEENLDRCFQLAHEWGCVLLLDKEDVFLVKRDKQDLKRNVLVLGEPGVPRSSVTNIHSVPRNTMQASFSWLQTESECLMMPPNPGSIHTSLYFPDLSWKEILKIWQMNLGRTHKDIKYMEIEEKEILKFAKKQYK